MSYVSKVVWSEPAKLYGVLKENKKPDSALKRLQYLNGLSLDTKEKAAVIDTAATEIFSNYQKKRSSFCGKFRSFISRASSQCSFKPNKRKERFLAIKTLYETIHANCAKKQSETHSPIAKKQALSESTSSSSSSSFSSFKPEPKLDSDKENPDPFQLLKRSYEKNPDKELQRLADNKVLAPEISGRIDLQLSKIKNYHSNMTPFSQNKLKDAKILLLRAHELKSMMKETHYALLHAQDIRWVIVSDLIKEIFRNFYDPKELKNFKFLRCPNYTVKDISIKDNPSLHDHHQAIRDELISCDGFFFHNTQGESAAYYLLHNMSILSLGNPNAIYECALAIINTTYKDQPKVIKNLDIVIKKAIAKLNTSEVGNLQVICVPKIALQEGPRGYLYRALPYGKPARPLRGAEEIGILDFYQDDIQEGPHIDQYRLLASHLVPGEGIIIKSLNLIDPSIRKSIKRKIQKAIS